MPNEDRLTRADLEKLKEKLKNLLKKIEAKFFKRKKKKNLNI
jgi:hypothetical protein